MMCPTFIFEDVVVELIEGVVIEAMGAIGGVMFIVPFSSFIFIDQHFVGSR